MCGFRLGCSYAPRATSGPADVRVHLACGPHYEEIAMRIVVLGAAGGVGATAARAIVGEPDVTELVLGDANRRPSRPWHPN